MVYYGLAVVGGIALFQLVPRMPHPLFYAALLPIALLIRYGPRWRLVALCAVGFLWAMWRAGVILDQRLEPLRQGHVFSVTGIVDTPSIDFGRGQKFNIKVHNVVDAGGVTVRLARVKLTWYQRHEILPAGSRCRLKVRLKTPHGKRNPGTFDREKWLFTERISATGYVVHHPANRCDGPPRQWTVDRIRGHIAAAIKKSLPAARQYAVIASLAVAERDGLTDEQWDVLRITGTAHLLAISGLHISLIAGIAFFAAHWGIGLFAPVNRCWPVQRPAALVALAAAVGYAALAGFPISTQRALVMLSVAMLCQFLRRPSISFEAYAMALVTVAILDPSALLTASFWLSFCAVGWLLFIHSTRPPTKSLPRLLLMHVYLALGLTPLLGALHQSVPLASPLANLIAVPVVTLAVVPLVLAGIVALPFDGSTAAALWRVSISIWDLLWSYLVWLAQTVGALALPSLPGPWAMGLATLGVAAFVVPVLRARWLVGSLLVATLALNIRTAPPASQFRVTVLDVGQGLAVVVETAHKVLIYDTGPAFGRFSSGADIIVPVLRARGIGAVDSLVLSHADLDHAGGWRGLAQEMPIEAIWVSPGHVLDVPTKTCSSGHYWVWDGVEFTFLSPRADATGSRNDLSCVLKISAPGGSILLSGDIEKRAEIQLVAHARAALATDILVAPHHGSTTSSSAAFIAAVDPSYVVFAAGYQNRFAFPRPQVVGRYLVRGIVPLITGVEGAIEFNISTSVERPRAFRRRHLRYWHTLEPAVPATDE